MKKILLLILAIVTYVGAYAAPTGIKLLLKNGPVTIMEFTENPKVTIEDGNLMLSSDSKTLQFSRSNVYQIEFLDLSGVSTNLADKNATFTRSGNTITFSELKAGSRIVVAAIDGKVVKNVTAEGSYVLNLNELTTGVYVVNVNGMSNKIIIR